MLTFLGGGRGCAGALTRPSTRHLLPKNFEKTALRKRGGIFTVKMRGGKITEMTVDTDHSHRTIYLNIYRAEHLFIC